jgi:hypothetical protein
MILEASNFVGKCPANPEEYDTTSNKHGSGSGMSIITTEALN